MKKIGQLIVLIALSTIGFCAGFAFAFLLYYASENNVASVWQTVSYIGGVVGAIIGLWLGYVLVRDSEKAPIASQSVPDGQSANPADARPSNKSLLTSILFIVIGVAVGSFLNIIVGPKAGPFGSVLGGSIGALMALRVSSTDDPGATAFLQKNDKVIKLIKYALIIYAAYVIMSLGFDMFLPA